MHYQFRTQIVYSLEFQNVPERKSCIVGELVDEWNTETGEDAIELTMDTDVCKGTDNEVNYIEHVQAFICKFIAIRKSYLPS